MINWVSKYFSLCINYKQKHTCLKVNWIASYFRSSSTFISSMIDLYPLSNSSCRFINFSFCSEKFTNWSKAFLLTWLYFFNSVLHCSSFRNNYKEKKKHKLTCREICNEISYLKSTRFTCLRLSVWYFSNASWGSDPSSRIFFIHSSFFFSSMPCLFVIFSNSLVSWFIASMCSFSIFFQRSILFCNSLIPASVLSMELSKSKMGEHQIRP